MNEQDRKAWKERIDNEIIIMGKELGETIIIDEGFQRALDSIALGENLFLTGSAGVGKSLFTDIVRRTFKGNMVVTATTGIASANIKGVTMHSMFMLPLKAIATTTEYNKVAKKIFYNKTKKSVIENMDLLVIDEISMAKGYNLDTIDHVLRNLRDDAFSPFGGVQVILIGDLMQLEPVVDHKGYEKDFLKDNYNGNPYFFNSSAYKTGNFNYIEFNHIYRQKDKEHQQVLNNFRSYDFSKKDLDYMNNRVVDESEFFNEGDYIFIATTNKKANEVNDSWLEALDGELITLNAYIEGQVLKSNIPETINLKPDAQIMMLRNDKNHRYFNGSLGIFKEVLDEETILVEVDGQEIVVERYEEKYIDYIYNKEENTVEEIEVGKKEQFPIKLAYSLTVHKTQGLSLDRAYIDFGRGCFAGGQAYVGLSRIRTLNGLGLKKPLKEKDFIISKHLQKFLEEVN